MVLEIIISIISGAVAGSFATGWLIEGYTEKATNEIKIISSLFEVKVKVTAAEIQENNRKINAIAHYLGIRIDNGLFGGSNITETNPDLIRAKARRMKEAFHVVKLALDYLGLEVTKQPAEPEKIILKKTRRR